jgi:DNA repair protein RadC
MEIWDKGLICLQEQFYVVYLNSNNEVVGWYDVAKGSVNEFCFDIRLVVALGLNCMAVKIIVAHNHPGGSMRPSAADIEMTKKLNAACRFFDIVIVDHLIISDREFYSMMEHKQL